jgi:apolipoprotein N-acyltransferase
VSRRPRGLRGPLGAGGLSGLLAALAFPPFHLWPLVAVALVPLVRFLARAGTTESQAARAGLVFGVAFYLPLVHWIPATLHGIIPGGALVGALGVAILVGVAGLQALVLRRLLHEGSVPAFLALPAVWVTAEFLLARAGPVAFPWTPLGLALASMPGLAAPAEWGGVAVLTLWIGLLNGGIADARARRPGLRLRPLATLAFLVLPAAWGVHRAERIPAVEVGPLDLVHLELPRDLLLDPEARDREAEAALLRLAGPGGVPILLPEAPFASSWEEGTADRVAAFARSRGTQVLAGARFVEEGRERNGMILVDGEGRELVRHGKVRLVPAAEWPEMAPGPDRGVIPLDGIALGILVCFETGFGSRARSLVRQGADLLANPTLDGWVRPVFRGPGERVWSAAHAQHRAHLVLRAIETRRGAVRSPVSGDLLVVDPSGRIQHRRMPGGEGVVGVRPLTTHVRTGFVRFGDVGGMAGVLLLGGLLLGMIPRRASG